MMEKFQNVVLASGSVFAALCIGFVMQNSPVAEMRYGPQVPVQSSGVQQDFGAEGPFSGITDLELTAITYTSSISPRIAADTIAPDLPRSTPELPVLSVDRLDMLSQKITQASTPAQDQTTALGCVATLRASPLAAAMVALELDAPCAPLTRVTLHHNGMMITEQTDAAGALSTQLPALSETAIYMASFENGLTAMAKAEVTSIDIYDRVVVQWEGPGHMQLHAFEFGADYGDAGHVWADQPRDMAQGALGKGGFVTVHGRPMPDQDLRAQVYTFPSGTSELHGEVDLSVEAEITKETCERRLDAQTLQITGGGALTVTDLMIEMPGCDAEGDFLVLKNLLQDLKIARN